MAIRSINSQELLESRLFMISFQRLSSILKMGYSMYIMPGYKVYSYGYFFNYILVDQASDSFMTVTLIFNRGGGT